MDYQEDSEFWIKRSDLKPGSFPEHGEFYIWARWDETKGDPKYCPWCGKEVEEL